MELSDVKRRRAEAQSRNQDPTPEFRQGISPVREGIGAIPDSSVVEPYPSPPVRKPRNYSLKPCFQWEHTKRLVVQPCFSWQIFYVLMYTRD